MARLERRADRMARVLGAGGHLLVLDFSVPSGRLRPIYRFYLHRCLPRLAGLVTGEKQAYNYLGASIERFPSGEAMCALMEASALSDAQAQPLSGGIVTIYCARKPQYARYGAAAGEPATAGDGVALGDGEDAALFVSGSFSAVRSGLLTTKVPSRPSALANHIPSSVRLPIVSLCSALSSGEVVKVTTNCGLSRPYAGVVGYASTQRPAREVSGGLFGSDFRSAVSTAPSPLIHFQSFGPLRTRATLS